MLREAVPLPAAGIVHWTDAVRAREADGSDAPAVESTLEVTFSEIGGPLFPVHKLGGTAFLPNVPPPVIDHHPDETERRAVTTPAGFAVAGSVRAPDRRFNPRLFRVVVDGTRRAFVPLFRTPFGTAIGPAGALVGRLAFADDSPASFAMLALLIVIPGNGTLRLRAQADVHGEFVLSLQGLPPLPQGAESYAAVLTVEALESASGSELIDPGTLEVREIRRTDTDDFVAGLALTITPGRTHRPVSSDHRHLVLRRPPP